MSGHLGVIPTPREDTRSRRVIMNHRVLAWIPTEPFGPNIRVSAVA